MQIFGPVLTVLTFRTAKEAIALANNTVFGLGASVWTENVSLGLEVAISLKAGACWINCHNQFDAAAGFGGYRESGYGRDGGKEVSCVAHAEHPFALVCVCWAYNCFVYRCTCMCKCVVSCACMIELCVHAHSPRLICSRMCD